MTFPDQIASVGGAIDSRTTQLTYMAVVLVTILLHAMFVATEYAIVKIASLECNSTSRLRQQLLSREIAENLEKYLQTCQIGKTMSLMGTGLCLGIALQVEPSEYGTAATTANMVRFGFGCLMVILVQLVVGFELPKTLGITKSEQCVSALSGFIIVSKVLFSPLAWAIEHLATFSVKRRT